MVHDFEDAIINAVKEAFPDIEFHYSCWFHFKQALRKRMLELKMSAAFIKDFLKLFDFLTIIDRDNIEKGVAYIRMKVKKIKGYKEFKGDVEKFFDDYFVSQWCRKRMIPMWNYNGREGWDVEM
jgi:hypothetical protein